jgi:hypothetical protein
LGDLLWKVEKVRGADRLRSKYMKKLLSLDSEENDENFQFNAEEAVRQYIKFINTARKSLDAEIDLINEDSTYQSNKFSDRRPKDPKDDTKANKNLAMIQKLH